MVFAESTESIATVKLSYPRTFFGRVKKNYGPLEIEFRVIQGLQVLCHYVFREIFSLSGVSLVLNRTESSSFVNFPAKEVGLGGH